MVSRVFGPLLALVPIHNHLHVAEPDETTGWFPELRLTTTFELAPGTPPGLQFPAVCQAVLVAPVQSEAAADAAAALTEAKSLHSMAITKRRINLAVKFISKSIMAGMVC
jgi:hypothetical protein